MADALSARQQIIDKIKESSNILVTVSQDPSVDELSAALGLTIMLNKLKKHATAVVSGDIPPAVNFLDPEKTFENTVDSLRDFIIALDKEKADHLRYKVEGDVVKIFITPYRTTITDQDLDFSQGDYNVELVLALGVTDESHLDKALEAHGKILHDATVATIGANGEPSQLGSIDWHDESASSLSEMLVSLSEAIKGDKPLLDEQTSTALLTGIVAATDRFSNNRTSSKVMTMSAQLMAAGANQQLIASKLQEANAIGSDAKSDNGDQNSDGTTDLSEDESTKVDKSTSAEKSLKKSEETSEDPNAGVLAVSHEKQGDLDDVAEQVKTEEAEQASERAQDALDETAKEVSRDETTDAAKAAEQKLAEELNESVPGAAEPAMGGTLNATTELAAEDKRREEADDRNKTILTHGEGGHLSNGSGPTAVPSFNANSQKDTDEQPIVDPFMSAPNNSPASGAPLPEPVLPSEPTDSQSAPANEPAGPQTLADIDAEVRHPHEDARDAVHAAFNDSPSQPAASVPDISGLPPLPDFSTLPPPPPPLPAMPSAPSSQPAGAIPPEKLADIFGTPPSSGAPETPPPAPANDPGQFKIPGQS
jgi:hypothetical protein